MFLLQNSFLSITFLLFSFSITKIKTYKTCEEVEFCRRLRSKESSINFEVVANTGTTIPGGVSYLLLNRETRGYVDFNITILQNNIAKIEISEQYHARFRPPYVLVTSPPVQQDVQVQFQYQRTVLLFNDYKLWINTNNLQIDVFKNDEWVIGFNNFFRLTLENNGENQAVAFDVHFPNATRGYGLPQIAGRLTLQHTTEISDPIRLFNNDNEVYEAFSGQALYGSVPLVYGYGTEFSAGVFSANAAETWVDITYLNDLRTYFMSAGGILETYLLLGPLPEDIAVQYASLTGTANLPPLWALGYHQSRNSYESQDEIKEIVANFDNNDIPLDAIWGDVAVQDSFRPFTWDPVAFSDPIEMLNNLSDTNRKFVTYVNPYLPVDDDYDAYDEAAREHYFIKYLDNSDFYGESIAGNSSWIDFYNDESFDFYLKQFSYSNYINSTRTLAGFCNNYNEPAVLSDEDESTIDQTVIYDGSILHRDVHNLYGLTQSRATYQALMNRDGNELRPFVMSRSFFAGSQRFAGTWIGNNEATWEHLKQSYTMCLNVALAGISLCGADVGGYYGDPEPELLVRWYQAGAWLPFFRGNSAPDTERREPYLQDEEVVGRIKTAIQKRYVHLPVFYTLFYENYRSGYPVIRPMFYAFPGEFNVVEIGDQLFLGNHIMVKLIGEPEITSVSVYFPGPTDQYWYEIETPLLFRAHSWQTVSVSLDYLPVFYASGSIVPLKLTNVSNTYDYRSVAYTMHVFLGTDLIARGNLYEDDFETFSYLRLNYSYFEFVYDNEVISMSPIDSGMPSQPSFVIDSFIIYRPPSNFNRNLNKAAVEPLVITKTSDGRNIKDLKFNSNEKLTFTI